MPKTRFGERMAARRRSEGIADSVAASGAAGGGGFDPVDGDSGFRRAGAGARAVPHWTLERARTYSVHAYRTHPMGRAIIDTFTAFCVGDSGLSIDCPDPTVRDWIERFWGDPANNLPGRMESLLRSHMLMGESSWEMLVTPTTGLVRFAPQDPTGIKDVLLLRGNPSWPGQVVFDMPDGSERAFETVRVDDLTGLRSGEVLWRKDWQALEWDRRGYPFLGPSLDWLEAYDRVLWNLIDRTALARYLVFDVTVTGGQEDIDAFKAARGTMEPPRSGSIEVHNEAVKWEVKTAQTGAFEDAATAQQALTNIAAGSGLSKTWLAEPQDANRATSLSMAEPVRRRIGGVQNSWLAHITEMVRFAVDQAVIAGRLPPEVTIRTDTGGDVTVPASSIARVTGPEIAAADAKINAEILVQLSAGLSGMVAAGILSTGAAKVAARKAWEDYVGVPYRPELDGEDGNVDALADYIDDQLSPLSG
jgi:hypothetical protein